MDKALLEVASEAVGHLIRNAVIHGIETPEERKRARKSPAGHIILSAHTTSSEIHIDVEDDGKGIDRQMLINYAARHDITLLPGEDPFFILFVSGYSTKKEMSLGAGRGIGLSAVKETVRRMGGHIEVESFEQIGTRFRLRLPLSVSIIRALILAAGNEQYAIPLDTIVATRRIMPSDIHEINHTLSLKWENETIPLLDISYLFKTSDKPRQDGCLVIIEATGKNRGLIVDEIAGIQEIVVKGLDPLIGMPVGISGSTILGDGNPILILDPASLVLINPQMEIAQ